MPAHIEMLVTRGLGEIELEVQIDAIFVRHQEAAFREAGPLIEALNAIREQRPVRMVTVFEPEEGEVWRV